MKLAIVVQRYGTDISGGAELHARYIAERLSRHAEVRVLATCARDYVTWRNELPAGVETVDGVTVERFPVARERDPWQFGRASERVFQFTHSIRDELAWLESEGPLCPALVRRLRRAQHAFDYVLLFSARYYQAYHGARAAAARAVLVPTAERDEALALAIFGPVFRGVRAIMYNSLEERAMIEAAAGNADVPNTVVGVGSAIPAAPDATRFRQKHGAHTRFVLYVGRIDPNKGCGELFDFFARYAERAEAPPRLLLIGRPNMEIPAHPLIRHIGAVGDEDKFDAIAAAEAIIVPSYYESLSMAALEAWALGRPVLANARCDVLVGQCLRSNAGLFYRDSAEFAAALDRILGDPAVAAGLGRNGTAYYRQHYDWPVIERKYLDMFARLDAETRTGVPRRMAPLPGWWARRRRSVPPAAAVLASLPSGPIAPRVGGQEART